MPHVIAHAACVVGDVHRFPAVQPAIPSAPEALGVVPKVLRQYYNITAVGQQESNMQAVAQFLGQYFNPADLTEFWNLFGDDFTHRDELTKIIGPNGAISGTEAALDVEYIMSTGANVSTYFISTGGTVNGQEPFLTWIQGVVWNAEVAYGVISDCACRLT